MTIYYIVSLAIANEEMLHLGAGGVDGALLP